MTARSVKTAVALACVALGLLALASGVAAAPAGPQTTVIYEQTPDMSGPFYLSSRNGTDYDEYVWDNFRIVAGQTVTITQITWRGGYNPGRQGAGTVNDFRVSIYGSTAAGSQPDVVNPPLVQYLSGGSANETYVGIFGLLRINDYSFTLPVPFQRSGPGTYWVQIEALQGAIPDWGFVAGLGGNNKHYLAKANTVGDLSYYVVPGDVAFALLGDSTIKHLTYAPITRR